MQTGLSFWGSRERTKLVASCWPKVTVFLSSEEGQRARWICRAPGEEPGPVSQWLTDVYRGQTPLLWREDFLPATAAKKKKKIPAHSISTTRNMWWILSFTLAKTMGFPVSNFYPNQMAWVYHSRGPGQAWGSSTTHSVDFYLHAKGFSDCHSFMAVGFLGAPRLSRLLSSYRQPGANRVKAVILENWTRGVKTVHGGSFFACVREIHSFLFRIRALLRIPVLSQHQR